MPSGVGDMADVVLGATQGDYTVIQSGLSPGDIVVTDGVDKLQNGSKVLLAPSGGGGHKQGGAGASTAAAGS